MKTNYIGGVVASLNLSRAFRKLREQLILDNFIIEDDNIYFKDIENKYSDLWDEYCEPLYPDDVDVTIEERNFNPNNKLIDFKVIIKIGNDKNTFVFTNFSYKKDKKILSEKELEYARYDILSLLVSHDIVLTEEDYDYFLKTDYQLEINAKANVYYRRANSKFSRMLQKCEKLDEDFVESVKKMNNIEYDKTISKIEKVLAEEEKFFSELEEE